MRVVANQDGTFTFSARLDEGQLRMLGALADFPLWSAQPRPVADMCADLAAAVRSAGVPVSAEAAGMEPETTISA